MNVFANIFSMILNSNPQAEVEQKSVVSDSSIYERLSAMDTVFYAYNDDELPFDLIEPDNSEYDGDDHISNNIFDDDYLEGSTFPGVNIDGTPMVDCTIDIRGNAYGVVEDDWMNDETAMSFEDANNAFDDSFSNVFEDSSTDMFSDDSSDMFEDSFSSFDDDNY
ncbi:MAG: hypothetical protein JXK16_03740 [Thiotrichales bacterium]|nr:hypothetical protein [Thiotrichales bacterium]